MPDTLTITIIFIALATLAGAVAKRMHRDKCLQDFRRNKVTLEKTDGRTIWGSLRLESTGLELVYSAAHKDEDGHDETSYILYKYEYPNIQALIRFHDELSQSNKDKRQRDLKRTYHPGPLRRLKRRTQNAFKTIRDSVAEVVNLLISRAQKASPVGATLTSQDKYVSRMKQELMGSVGTSFEPLLERYIGNKVVLELIKGDKIFEYCGLLKDYTADFIEIMDVSYKATQDQPARRADLVVPRKYGVVRHLGE